MQSIGERLEEARKRKGISLREAAEATKIRSDFLANFEQNRFDFELPEIYKRGFIRNYARYLKIDDESLLNDYNAQLLGNTRASRRSTGSEWFGRIDPPAPREEKASTAATLAAAPLPDTPQPAPALPATPEPESPFATEPKARNEPGERRTPGDIEPTVYLKIGLVLAGSAALVVILFALVSAVLSGGGGESGGGEEVAAETPAETRGTENGGGQPAAPASATLLRLQATGPTFVHVRRSADRSEIFKGTLNAGDVIEEQKLGPVDILWTQGENLEISVGDRRVQTQDGTAKISIP